MAKIDLRAAIDDGDIDAVRSALVGDRDRVAARLRWRDGSGVHLSAPIGYVSIARFHGLTDHEHMGEITRVLLQSGAPVNGEPDCRETPLITAASYGEGEVARALIDAGADLEATGFAVEDGTALAHAVYFGNPEVVDLLVAAGARIRSIADAAGSGDLRGWLDGQITVADGASALRAAAVCERVGAIDELLATGVSIDAEHEDGTALHWAAFHGKPTAVRHLIARGGDAGRRDARYDATPLGWCQHRHEELYRQSPGHDAVERYLGALAGAPDDQR